VLLRPIVTKASNLQVRGQIWCLSYSLFEWVDELQTEKTHVAGHILSQYPRKDGGSLTWNETVGRRRGGRDRQMNCLIRAENMLGSDASPESTDIKGLSKLDELRARRVCAANKYGNLQTNAG